MQANVLVFHPSTSRTIWLWLAIPRITFPVFSGIGDKTAVELVQQYGDLESILAHAAEITKKRPREALLEFADNARLSKELVTIRDDLAVDIKLDAMRIQKPDNDRLRELFVELEFHTLAKAVGTPAASSARQAVAVKKDVSYRTVDTIAEVERVVALARKAGTVAIDTETLLDPDNPQKSDPLRAKLVSLAIAVAPGEAYYFPLQHVLRRDVQSELLIDAAGDRAPTDAPTDRGLVRGGDEPVPRKVSRKKVSAASGIAGALLAERARAGEESVRNLPALRSDEMRPLRDLLEDPSIKKAAQNAKYDLLVLRKAGVEIRGLNFDTMLASYVLDPSRRSHGLDVLALEFLDHTMTSYSDLCGKGRSAIPFDECPIDAARDYAVKTRI